MSVKSPYGDGHAEGRQEELWIPTCTLARPEGHPSYQRCYDTGGMRRTHLRKHNNILKRLLIHVAGANLGLLLRNLYRIGTQRGLQGFSLTLHFFFVLVACALESQKNGCQSEQE